MKRRTFMIASAALAAPSIARAQTKGSPDLLRTVPAADMASLDPDWTAAAQTRDHAFLVYDTLYGLDNALQPQPQMVAGHVVEDGEKTWRMTLRDGLLFHDNTPVLARDCVASVRRFAARDGFGQSMLAATNEISAPDDKTILFRLKYPFPQLPAALAKISGPTPAIMPERLALTDPFKQVTDPTGSGPFRYIAAERVPGAKTVYEKFAAYRPRPDGTPQGTAGPKVAYFKRVEVVVMPDGQTAVSALQRGEVDYLRWPLVDLLPVLRSSPGVSLAIIEPLGLIGLLRLNHAHPPFDNPAVRRAILPALSQAEYMQATNGQDRTLWRDAVGFFTPGTPMASDIGMDAFTAPRDLGKAKAALAASGYTGARCVVMNPTDFTIYSAMANVTAELLKKIGFNVDLQTMDWATMMQRRTKSDPVEQGGWSVFHTGQGGMESSTPIDNVWLRGNGAQAAPGWPASERLESLRDAWLKAPDIATQQKIARDIQGQAFTDLPYIPAGLMYTQVAYRSDLTGILKLLPAMWNIRRT
jgi:peptide/nickel transport system substrate-binding protein